MYATRSETIPSLGCLKHVAKDNNAPPRLVGSLTLTASSDILGTAGLKMDRDTSHHVGTELVLILGFCGFISSTFCASEGPPRVSGEALVDPQYHG